MQKLFDVPSQNSALLIFPLVVPILCIVLYFLPSSGVALTQAQLPLTAPATNIQQLGLWQAVIPYGSESEHRPVSQAFKEFNGLIEAFDALDTQARLGAQGGEHWVGIRRALEREDLSTFVNRTLPGLGGAPGGTRMIHFKGAWDSEKHFQLAFGAPFSPGMDSTLPTHDPLRAMGDMEGIFAIQPNPQRSGEVTMHWDMHMHLGTLLFSEMLASMETFHQLIEHSGKNRSLYEQSSSEIALTSLVSEFETSAPNIMQNLRKFAEFQPEVWLASPEIAGTTNNGPAGTLHARFRFQFDLPKLKAHFPHTWRDNQMLFEDTSFESAFILPANDGEPQDTIATITYDAKNAQLAIHFRVHQGGLVTTLGRVIHPTRLAELAYTMRNNVTVNFYGLRIRIENMNVDHQYAGLLPTGQASARQASIQMAMNAPPDVEVSGALLKVIPSWLIDVLIPGTLESLIRDVFAKMIGMGEDKLAATFLFDEHSGQHIVHFHMRMPLPYQVVQDAFKARAEREAAHPAAFKMEESIYQVMRIALRRDFERMASRLPLIEPPG